MIVWWVFLGICIALYSIYNFLVNGPKEGHRRNGTEIISMVGV